MANDLTNLQAQYGVTSSGTTSVDDPPLFLGQDKPRSALERQERLGKPTTSGARVVPMSQHLKDFFAMSLQELRAFQERAFAAGLYGTMKRQDVPFGFHDETTQSIWETMATRAAGFYAAGQKVTPDEVLSRAEQARQAQPGPAGTQLPDAGDIRAVIRETARKVAGKRISDAEVEKIASDYEAKLVAADQPGALRAAPSLDTFTETSVRQSRPEDAFGQDYTSRMNEFYSLLSGPV